MKWYVEGLLRTSKAQVNENKNLLETKDEYNKIEVGADSLDDFIYHLIRIGFSMGKSLEGSQHIKEFIVEYFSYVDNYRIK